jgi:hypothetical protein
VATGQWNKALLVVGTGYGVYAFRGYGLGNKDIDEDGVLNYLDNCPRDKNADQADADRDGTGDACNDATDNDSDEWTDGLDNCPLVANVGQSDADSNGTGDACNNAEDEDGDEWDNMLDNCLGIANSNQADRDNDRVGDVCDPYPDNPDNYAARCEEAIVNEANLGVELGACMGEPKFVDSDSDGESDSTDACPGTLPLAAVDAAGCDQSQFCKRYSGSGAAAVKVCSTVDWRNDEPTTLAPRDCSVRPTGGSWIDPVFECAIR